MISNKSVKKIDVRKRKKDAGSSLAELDYTISSSNQIGEMEKFHSSQGHGFAAEQSNNLIDVLSGRDAVIVGNDNAKDGADRFVDGQYIQTKYCQTAHQSVNAAFENNRYRYIDQNGKAMQLEVPADQYEEAVAEMEKRISKGEVPGYKNPKDARKIVRKGNVTYQQAVNISKAGRIEGLIYDAANSAVISASAFGISTVITFAKSLWEGKEIDVAIEKSLCAGLKVGGIAFASSLLTGQLVRTGLNSAMRKSSEIVVKNVLTSTKSKELAIRYFEDGANMYAAQTAKQITSTEATNKAAKLLRGNLISSVVLITVMSANDIRYAFSGKISGKQLFKNIMTIAGSLAGGSAGAVLGGFIGTLVPIPGASAVGFYAGGFLGGAAGGSKTNQVLSRFIEDDAVEMVRILESRFVPLVDKYCLSQEEIEIVLDDLRRTLVKDKLLEMFASSDRDGFADELLTELIEKLVRNRCLIYLPSQSMYLSALDRVYDRAKNNLPLVNETELEATEVAKSLLGREISEQAARKAWYMTKQMNTINLQAEYLLCRSKENESKKQVRLKQLEAERLAIKESIKEYMEGDERCH